jgi:PGF-CTERM protein
MPSAVSWRAVGLVLVVALAIAAASAAGAPGTALDDDAERANGTASVDHAATVDPTLSVPDARNRTANLTATVSVPEDATDSRRFVVRLYTLGGGEVANRTITVESGESVPMDFGACLPARSYVVRVLTTDGDVVVAKQVEVERSTPLFAFDDAERVFAEQVTRNDTLRVDGRLHPCVDRTTVALAPVPPGGDADPAWSATVRDSDGDGAVSFAWDVDGQDPDALAAGDGTALDDVRVNRVVPYGEYRLQTTTADGVGETGRVTVSFANPTVEVYTANAELNATAALAAARDGDPVDDGPVVQVVDDDWVVLRFDVDGTLSTLPADASLVAPASHENATVRLEGFYAGVEDEASPVDLANATRRFDAQTGTLWYAYRANDSRDRTGFTYVAIGEEWNATARTNVQAVRPVRLAVREGGLFAPERVTVGGESALPSGTNLNVSVRTANGTVAREPVVVDDDPFHVTFDLSDVPKGTNASVVVADGDRVLVERNVTVAKRPILELRGYRTNEDGDDQLQAGVPNEIRAYLLNRGNAPGNATVVFEVGNYTVTRNVSVPAEGTSRVAVSIPPEAIPDRERVDVSVSFAGETESRPQLVVPAETTATTTTPTTTGTEPWPTLAGTDRGTDEGPTPGFGATAAVAALVAALAMVARRADAD